MDANISVISADALEDIRRKVRTPPLDSSHIEKEYLKNLSDDRAGKWPNTIEAQRARKERARKERMDQEEQERCEVDRQEALLKAENRRLQIERANKMLYDETDRVKSFHSKLLLSDVLQEREAQINYKSQLKGIKKKQDDAFVRAQAQAIEVAEAAEHRKLEYQKMKALEQKDAQMAQLEELKDRILRDKEHDKAEGFMLKKKAAEEVLLLQQKEEERRERALLQNMETARANDALKKLKAIDKQREKDEEKKIAEFAKRKEEMILERRRREESKISDKTKARERMVRVMEDDLLRRREESELRLVEQAEELEAKENAAMQQRAEQMENERLAIDRSRNQQKQIKKAIKDKERAEEMELSEQMKLRHEMQKMEEEEERVSQYARNKKLQNAHLRQIEKKRVKNEQHRNQELAEAEATRLILAEDDELFKQYTGVCMEEWALQGKSLKPMQLEIAKKDKVTN
eukprot:gene9833-11648_t